MLANGTAFQLRAAKPSVGYERWLTRACITPCARAPGLRHLEAQAQISEDAIQRSECHHCWGGQLDPDQLAALAEVNDEGEPRVQLGRCARNDGDKGDPSAAGSCWAASPSATLTP